MLRFLEMAAGVALPTTTNDRRRFWLGCVGVRQDGTMVSSRNGASEFSCFVQDHQLLPTAHAEGRVLRKLGKRGELYVARVSKKDGILKLAKPCGMCQTRIRSAQVEKVYYSISSTEYGLWLPSTNEWRNYQE